ncbi:MAG: DUF6150 family protein, partial [Candidatus Aegiribacteria sp.]
MKKALLTLVLTAMAAPAGNVYVCDYAYQADLQVYAVDYRYQADLCVYPVEYGYQA